MIARRLIECLIGLHLIVTTLVGIVLPLVSKIYLCLFLMHLLYRVPLQRLYLASAFPLLLDLSLAAYSKIRSLEIHILATAMGCLQLRMFAISLAGDGFAFPGQSAGHIGQLLSVPGM